MKQITLTRAQSDPVGDPTSGTTLPYLLLQRAMPMKRIRSSAVYTQYTNSHQSTFKTHYTYISRNLIRGAEWPILRHTFQFSV